ncbi:unnamed protein product [Urochloa decumbens]|uniref:non-specific serine/threonine protein kinase n=1 Tax=Urochloa decumbens TaxID=240449 RepID=A0ABC9F920_9POAL
MKLLYLPALIFLIMLLCLRSSAAGTTSDTLNNGGNITDGETLVSAGGSFTLGFFSPTGVPAKRYLGIWFTASPDAVCWVANRDSPLSNDTSGVLVIRSPGIVLRLLDGSGHAAWSSEDRLPTSSAPAPDAVAQLLDSGNLVVREQQRSGGNVLWQSFGDPSNTLVAGMTLGAERSLTSWRAPNDPTSGDCRHVMDTKGLPDCVTWQGNVKKYRTGPWNGLRFSGVPETEMTSHSDSQNEVAYIFNNTADAPFSRLVLNEVCVLQRLAWDPASRVWNTSVQAPTDVCDDYAICGAFGVCNVNMASTLVCSCIVGFNPVNQSQWSMREFSGGCRRNVPLECSNGTTTDGFMVLRGVNLPDTYNTTVDMSATLEQCRARCSSSCWCVAYAAADIRGGGGGSGCITWINDIVDIRYVDKGQDLYVRLAKSEFGAQRERRRNVAKIVISVTAASLLAVTVAAVTYLVWKRKFRGLRRKSGGQSASNKHLGDEALELPFVSFREIVSATNNFSEDYMLGRGGFGKVYKGTMLVDNKQVAIKRLGKGTGENANKSTNKMSVTVLEGRSSAAGTTPDTLNNGGNITDGETLVSSGGSFTLGFFSPTGVPAKRYLGIWFTASPDAVCWVANRDTALSDDTSGSLVIGSTGILRLLDGSGQAVWSSTTTSPAPDAVAQLLDTGNLVVREQSSGSILWQSFDHPSNTLLAGMRLGKNPQTGEEWSLTSWRAPDDPSPGHCRRVMDTKGLPEGVSWQGNVKVYRTGPWNGLWFSGIPEMPSYSDLFSNQVIVRPDEIAYIFNAATAEAPISRFVLNEVGVLQRLAWDPASGVWNTLTQAPRDVCDGYAMCGAFGICNLNMMSSTLICSCVLGFSPDLYVRLAKSEFSAERDRRDVAKVVVPVTAASLLVLTVTAVWKCKLRGVCRNSGDQSASNNELGDEDLELPFISFREIVSATNNFSEDCMLGRGGFGKVYMGMVDNKQVAIKRLGKGSRQGAEEFRNEVVLIAKLQHRNLVRLLGFCIHGDEKLLIYEYLPNKCLHSFLFDASSKRLLDWATRFKIIKGIARGLLYLHQDSRLTIIHRDLKSSNILLDSDMSPKISDFGMARLFSENQQEAKTSRVVGTYGYMSPEYAMDGTFSVKSDTYSFGVILLEIISGLKITSTQFTSFPNLLAYAWSLWNDDKAIDLVDSSLVESCSPTEALRCIHIGLLCVQDNPNSRPLMSSVVSMLENETTPLSVPKQPLYFSQWYLEAQGTGENANKSTNKMSVTVLEGR